MKKTTLKLSLALLLPITAPAATVVDFLDVSGSSLNATVGTDVLNVTENVPTGFGSFATGANWSLSEFTSAGGTTISNTAGFRYVSAALEGTTVTFTATQGLIDRVHFFGMVVADTLSLGPSGSLASGNMTYDSGTGVITGATGGSGGSGNAGQGHGTIILDAPTNSIDLTFDDVQNGSFYINFSGTAVPEPTSSVLVLLSGLAFGLRRRRA